MSSYNPITYFYWSSSTATKTVEETQKNTQNSLLENLFKGPYEHEKVYSFSDMNHSFKFNRHNSENPYLRRSDVLPSSYDAFSNYHSHLLVGMIQKYLGPSKEKISMCNIYSFFMFGDVTDLERSEIRHLQRAIEQKDPKALQVAAALFQLVGDDSSSLPPLVENADKLLQKMQSPQAIITNEVGHIQIAQNENLEITIKGDRVGVLNLLAYETERKVTIGYPREDGSVSCRVTTTFHQVYPKSDS